MKPGDVVTIDAPGGGGYGNPLERDPERKIQGHGCFNREEEPAAAVIFFLPPSPIFTFPAQL